MRESLGFDRGVRGRGEEARAQRGGRCEELGGKGTR